MDTKESIKIQRLKAGLTQKELGERLNISSVTVGQWETGKRKPKYETLKRIAAALNVDEIELIDGAIDPLKARTISSEEEYNLSKLETYFYSVSDKGQEKIVNYAEDLTKVPEYQRTPDQEEE